MNHALLSKINITLLLKEKEKAIATFGVIGG
jgi:hypothetical protein